MSFIDKELVTGSSTREAQSYSKLPTNIGITQYFEINRLIRKVKPTSIGICYDKLLNDDLCSLKVIVWWVFRISSTSGNVEIARVQLTR